MAGLEEFEASGYTQLPESASGERSPVERLLAEFEAHEQKERGFVQIYRELTKRSKSPRVRFLLNMIASDEERHYAVARAMATTLRGSVDGVIEAQPLTHVNDDMRDVSELLRITEEFIRVEEEGIDEYRKLSKDSPGYYDGLLVLLLSTMIRDSEKHLEILKFLHRTLKAK